MSPPLTRPRRIFVDATPSSVTLDFDLKTATLGPAVQLKRAQRTVEAFASWGDGPLTNDTTSAIFDGLVAAAIALNHIFDYALAEAKVQGKQAAVEAVKSRLAARVITDICNGSKHRALSGSGKTSGPLRIHSEGNLGSSSCKEYASSIIVECEGQSWAAGDLFRDVLQEWAALMKADLGLPVDLLMRSDAEVEVSRMISEGVERRLNVERGNSLAVTVKADASGRIVARLGGDDVPVPDSIAPAQTVGFLLHVLTDMRAQGTINDDVLLSALDGLLLAAQANKEFASEAIVAEMTSMWRNLRTTAREARRRLERAGAGGAH